MSTIRLQPHKTLPPSVWKPEPWEVVVAGRAEPSKGYIEEFDYSLRFNVAYSAKINIGKVEGLLGIGVSRSISAWALADCMAGGVRLATSVLLLPSGDVRVEIEIPEGVVAGELEVRRGLAYSPVEDKSSLQHIDASSNVILRAHNPASRLLEADPERIRLEGGWSRFPIEAGSFEQMGLEYAAWTINIDYETPNDPFLGAVRLMINLDHPAGREVVKQDGGENSELYLAALRTDVFRQLFQQLACDARFGERRYYEPESIGAVATGMAEDTLRNDLPTILGLLKDSPAQLDRLIQERTNYLEVDE